MSDIIINGNPLGEDAIKGGVYFNSSLTPAGTFSNTPNFYKYTKPNDTTDGQLVLTLQKIKDSLKEQLKEEDGADVDETYVERFLFEYTSLLIDYKDMRNFVFYGSANTELAYNIKYLIENYPFKYLISTLTTTLGTNDALVKIVNRIQDEETDLIFSQDGIRDGIENFNFFDTSIDFDWSTYEIIDQKSNTFPVLKVITPYISTTINKIVGLVNVSTQTPVTARSPIPKTYSTLKITTQTAHGYVLGQMVSITETYISNGTEVKSMQNDYVISNVISTTEFLIVSKYAANKILAGDLDMLETDGVTIPVGYTLQTGENIIRKAPLDFNDRPYWVKMTIKGNFFENNLTSYENSDGEFSGFIISPNKTVLSEFDYNLTPIQQMLLAPAPINPTPWPRRDMTKNIKTLLESSPYNQREEDFVSWLQDPNFMYMNDGVSDDDISFSDGYMEYRLVRALGLDETYSNQLVRRCIPQDMISEINDTADADFQRFILIAGWFFDQIRLYIQFTKYVHHLNHTDFNQLSPEYYRYFASHYGMDLFDDDGIDFSKLVISTEPGLQFRQQAVDDPSNKYYKKTLQQLQYERQKRLLLSLFYLYKSKGTAGTVSKLVQLLGAPEGFFLFNEYVYQIQGTDENDYYPTSKTNTGTTTRGLKIVDNQKIYSPEYYFEEDPDYPVTNGMPPVYRMRLKNESTFNLRSVSIQTNPNGAIDNQVLNVFGATKYNYGKFNYGEFANLQNMKSDLSFDTPYRAIPLSIPDKFAGVSIEYMIPKEGFTKGIGNNQEEVSIHLCSLYQLPGPVTSKVNAVYPYPVPEAYSNFNFETFKTDVDDNTPDTDGQPNVYNDFSLLKRYEKTSQLINFDRSYIICRLEGKDLVVRAKVLPENANTDNGERVAILPNVFESDGLNHTLRVIFRPEGVEVYQDYTHLGINNGEKIGIALWRNPAQTNNISYPFMAAFEIPKQMIPFCQPKPFAGDIFFANPNHSGVDAPELWDLFIGLPVNIDFFFKRVTVFENYAADSFAIVENMINEQNYTAEYWSFIFTDNGGDKANLKIRCEHSQVEPNINNAIDDFTDQYGVEQFNNKIVIQDLILSSKEIRKVRSGGNLVPLGTQKYFNQIQDFFNVKKLFEQNAYQKNIHAAYEYDICFAGKVIKLYNLYSSQVLTYDSLASFLDLIENKFKPVIKDFIPIVINISEFGRLISNSKFYQPKMRYTNMHKRCVGGYKGLGILQFRIFEELPSETDFIIQVHKHDGTDLIPPFEIDWLGNEELTEFDFLDKFRSSFFNPYNKQLKPRLSSGLFVMTIDPVWYSTTFNGDPNAVEIIILNAADNTVLFRIKFEHGAPVTAGSDCAVIEYTVPKIKVNGKFIYFAEEDKPQTYIWYGHETGHPDTYIKYD
jgi:hypothetical protein